MVYTLNIILLLYNHITIRIIVYMLKVVDIYIGIILDYSISIK